MEGNADNEESLSKSKRSTQLISNKNTSNPSRSINCPNDSPITCNDKQESDMSMQERLEVERDDAIHEALELRSSMLELLHATRLMTRHISTPPINKNRSNSLQSDSSSAKSKTAVDNDKPDAPSSSTPKFSLLKKAPGWGKQGKKSSTNPTNTASKSQESNSSSKMASTGAAKELSLKQSASDSTCEHDSSHGNGFEDESTLEQEIDASIRMLQAMQDVGSHARPPKETDDEEVGTGYIEFSTLYNAAHRMRENLRQTSVEADETLALYQSLQKGAAESHEKHAKMEKALCKLYKENVRLKDKLQKKKRSQKSMLKDVREYVATVQSKNHFLEEEATLASLRMHEKVLSRQSTGQSFDTGDDRSIVSNLSMSSEASSLITDEGVATVKLSNSFDGSTGSNQNSSPFPVPNPMEIFRKAKKASNDTKQIYKLFYAPGEKIGLQFHRVPVASIHKNDLEESLVFEEGDAGIWNIPSRSRTSTLESVHEDGGHWKSTRSRTSTFDSSDLFCSNSAEDVHVHKDHPNPSCYMLCGYKGFDATAHFRPALGAKLVEINGESLEFGSIFFDELRDNMDNFARSGKQIELSFRNDNLTKRQKDILNRAVSEVGVEKEADLLKSSTIHHLEYMLESNMDSYKYRKHHKKMAASKLPNESVVQGDAKTERVFRTPDRKSKESFKDKMRKMSEEFTSILPKDPVTPVSNNKKKKDEDSPPDKKKFDLGSSLRKLPIW